MRVFRAAGFVWRLIENADAALGWRERLVSKAIAGGGGSGSAGLGIWQLVQEHWVLGGTLLSVALVLVFLPQVVRSGGGGFAVISVGLSLRASH